MKLLYKPSTTNRGLLADTNKRNSIIVALKKRRQKNTNMPCAPI